MSPRFRPSHVDAARRGRRPLGVAVAIGIIASACAGGATLVPTGLAGLTWHLAADLPASGGASLAKVIAAGPGLVAVGQRSYAGPGIAWTSVDGATWQSVAQVSQLTHGRVLLALGAGPGAVVAIGPMCGGECGGAFPIVSADGMTWTSGQQMPPVVGFTEVKDLVWGGHGFLAVGDEIVNPDPIAYVAHVWSSPDGLTWKVLPASPALDGASMSSVARTANGFVAVGAVQDGQGFRGAAWTSHDGSSWRRAADSAAFDGAFLFAVVAGGPGLVAVGKDANGAAVWTSSDGSSWQRIPDTPSFHDAEMHAIAAGHAGFVAVGYDQDGAAMWTSADGVTWVRDPGQPDFQGAEALSVAVSQATYVVVGGANPNANARAFVWVSG